MYVISCHIIKIQRLLLITINNIYLKFQLENKTIPEVNKPLSGWNGKMTNKNHHCNYCIIILSKKPTKNSVCDNSTAKDTTKQVAVQVFKLTVIIKDVERLNSCSKSQRGRKLINTRSS